MCFVRWIHWNNNKEKLRTTENNFVKGKFNWQEGFGAFSYSRSQIDNVIKYILNQEKHHSVQSFKDEYFDFLKKFEIEYDEKYLFDWID